MINKIDSLKTVQPDYSILSIFGKRWSPYAFSSRPVSPEDMRACFEAARWAPSSYNEQPWRYVVATSEQKERFDTLVECLAEGNRPWAKRAPVLAIGMYKQTFERNGKENKAAPHDLGIASAFLTVEATHRGLHVHQMIGIEPDTIREKFDLPENVEPYTAIALGYLGDHSDLDELPEDYAKRDKNERTRLEQSQFVFGGDFGVPLDI
jgi:nitroreductase